MIHYKCAKCGSGELESLDNGRKAICVYCNSVMVLPTLDPNTFNRANELRLRKEYDKAQLAFERIVEDNPKDSESYWNLVLCRYGIDYIKDSDGTMIPNCNRMSYNSIFDDPDYQNALKYADGNSYRYYQDEAAKIDSLMKRIAHIAQTQPSYDIFISYKETDHERNKTLDSTIAQDIYDGIKEKHPEWNVFLSRVTLKNIAAGMEYEPIIFSALNSAKLMIVVGTSRENLESTWVRNEWSRYRDMMEKNSEKNMFTVYRDMDPTKDFPKELRLFKIQATEARGMYLPDLITGIEKHLGWEKKKIQNDELYSSYVPSGGSQTNNLIKRAEQEIRSGRLENARKFLQMALDLDAGCASAWWILFKLDTDFLKYIDNTKEFTLSFDAQNDWEEIRRCASAQELREYERQFDDYKKRWNDAAAKLKAENNEKFVNDGIAEIIDSTKNGKNFDEYADYKRSSEFAKQLYEIATSRQKDELDKFYGKFEINFAKFKELQKFKESNPCADIEALPQYKMLEAEKTSVSKGYFKTLRRQNGMSLLCFIWVAIVAVVTFLVKEYAYDFVSISSHILPILVALSVFATILGVLRFRCKGDNWESTNLIFAVILSIISYFLFQYLLFRYAVVIDPTINWHCIFFGFIALLFIASVLIGIITIFFGGGLWGGLFFGGVLCAISYAIYHFVPIFRDSEPIPEKILRAICMPVYDKLLLVAIVAAVIRLIMYIFNVIVSKKVKSLKILKEAKEKAFADFYDSKCDELGAPYKEFVDEVYLENMSEVDEIEE